MSVASEEPLLEIMFVQEIHVEFNGDDDNDPIRISSDFYQINWRKSEDYWPTLLFCFQLSEFHFDDHWLYLIKNLPTTLKSLIMKVTKVDTEASLQRVMVIARGRRRFANQTKSLFNFAIELN